MRTFVLRARAAPTDSQRLLAEVGGDALLLADEPAITIGRGQGAELLVFDLPKLD